MGNVSKWEMARINHAQLHARMDAAADRERREAEARRVMIILLCSFVAALCGMVWGHR